MLKLNARKLRKLAHSSLLVTRRPRCLLNEKHFDFAQRRREASNEIYIILDNVLDTYNVGSIFRLADGVNAKKIYLCGKTETPPNPRIKKASINTTEIVEWEYSETAQKAVSKLKSQNSKIKIVAVEQSEKSVQYDKFNYKLPVALIVGNETYGVSKEILQNRMIDGIVEIPMFGVNISLNVMVSLAIVLYKIIEKNIK